MDLTDDEITTIADELGVSPDKLQSEAVKDCAESVKEDRDVSEERAFAICQDMDNEGLLASPTHVTLADLQEPGAIERDEEEDGTVRYGSVLLLAPGIWGDAGSGRHILYSPEGIENSADNWEDNTVNLFHERENEVTDVGEVDTDSIFLGEDDGGLYGDIVLHMDNPASEFADEALQNALETGGREGLQGPSVELRGEDYRWNEDEGVHELVEGTFNGLGLVGLGVSPGPGSEDAAFAEQTRERAVALAEDGGADVLTRRPTHVTMELTELQQRLEEHGLELGDDADEEALRNLAADIGIELQEDEDDEEEPDDDEESGADGDGDEEEPDDDDGEDDVDINLEDVASRVDEIGSRVEENSAQIEEMAARFEDLDDGANLSDLFDTVAGVSETLETLADAETVEELDQRLSELEDEPEDPTSLADVGGAEADGGEGKVLVGMGSGATHKPRVTKERF